MGRQAESGHAVAEAVLNSGRLNVGRLTLCRETQAHTLPAGPIERISSGNKLWRPWVRIPLRQLILCLIILLAAP